MIFLYFTLANIAIYAFAWFLLRYSDRFGAYPLLIGMVVGLTITLTIETLQAIDHNDNQHHFSRHRFDPLLPSGLWAVVANVAVREPSRSISFCS